MRIDYLGLGFLRSALAGQSASPPPLTAWDFHGGPSEHGAERIFPAAHLFVTFLRNRASSSD